MKIGEHRRTSKEESWNIIEYVPKLPNKEMQCGNLDETQDLRYSIIRMLRQKFCRKSLACVLNPAIFGLRQLPPGGSHVSPRSPNGDPATDHPRRKRRFCPRGFRCGGPVVDLWTA